MTRPAPDYQQFDFEKDGSLCNIGPRLSNKLEAIPLPNLKHKDVLDVGCDFGFWSFYSSSKGARMVLGLDRNRDVRGSGFIDLVAMNTETSSIYNRYSNCSFRTINLGKQWFEFGDFDVVLLFSLYHHIYQNTGGDHNSIWYWLRCHTRDDGILVWENPTDTKDAVSFGNINKEYHGNYTKENILRAAEQYFEAEYIGPAKHEPHRDVYYFHPKINDFKICRAVSVDGAGGATKAFEHENNRRVNEITNILGMMPLPGSLNLIVEDEFNWDWNYYRAEVLDVKDRKRGMNSEWSPRWARFYPILLNGIFAHAFRFEGEKYPKNFVEVIAPYRLRDLLKDKIELWH